MAKKNSKPSGAQGAPVDPAMENFLRNLAESEAAFGDIDPYAQAGSPSAGSPVKGPSSGGRDGTSVESPSPVPAGSVPGRRRGRPSKRSAGSVVPEASGDEGASSAVWMGRRQKLEFEFAYMAYLRHHGGRISRGAFAMEMIRRGMEVSEPEAWASFSRLLEAL